MAIKYCDPSATYNGDGTASTGAASAGAAGAWNNFQNVLEGTPTYGSVVAGDEIIFRTYNGGDITVNWTKNLVMTAAGTAVSPIIFRFDDGTVWTNGGTLKLSSGTSNYTITSDKNIIILSPYNHTTLTYGWKLENNSTSGGLTCFSMKGGRFQGVEFSSTATQYKCVILQEHSQRLCFDHCFFNTSPESTIGIFYDSGYDGCTIALKNCVFNGKSYACIGYFRFIGSNNRVEIVGGKVINTVPNGYLIKEISAPGINTGTAYYIDGLDVGLWGFSAVAQYGSGLLQTFAISKDYAKALMAIGDGVITWETGQNYPTLNAILPDSTPWSWRCFPNSTNGMNNPLVLSKLRKYYTGTTGTKTITLELCIKDTSAGSGAYDTLHQSAVWVEVGYTDANGHNSQMSPRISSALTTSSATWTPEVSGKPIYAANNYDKYRITVTTPTAILQNTWLDVQLFFALPSIYSDDYFFVDPDIVIS